MISHRLRSLSPSDLQISVVGEARRFPAFRNGERHRPKDWKAGRFPYNVEWRKSEATRPSIRIRQNCGDSGPRRVSFAKGVDGYGGAEGLGVDCRVACGSSQ
jgi:hypothetical protein